MIKVEPVYMYTKPQGGKIVSTTEDKRRDTVKGERCSFEYFKATIGDKVYHPIPIGFLRISELPALQQMLIDAYELGKADECQKCEHYK